MNAASTTHLSGPPLVVLAATHALDAAPSHRSVHPGPGGPPHHPHGATCGAPAVARQDRQHGAVSPGPRAGTRPPGAPSYRPGTAPGGHPRTQ